MTIRYLLTTSLVVAALNANALQVHLDVYATSCEGNNGAVIATASGGTPPYNYSWNDGSTESERYGLLPGTYTLTVTDQLGQVAVEEAWVYFGGAPSNGSMLLMDVAFPGLAPCTGQCNGGFRFYVQQQFGGYSISTTPAMSIVENNIGEPENVSYYQRYEILGACAGQTVELNVSNACGAGSVSFTMPALFEPSLTVGEITGSCAGANNGTIAGEVTVVSDPLTSEDSWIVRAIDGLGAQVAPLLNPIFMTGTQNFQIINLHPGDWTLRFSTVEGYGSAQQPCVLEVPVTVPNLGTACATLSGTVHYETDLDCVQDGLEMGIPYQMMKVTPGPMYGMTSTSGNYSVALPYGSYAVEQLNPNAVQLCPPAAPIAFSVSSGNNAVVNIADSMLTPFDLATYVHSGISRVGYPFTFAVGVYNNTGASGEEVTVTFSHDPLFSFISGSAGAVVSAGQVEWSIPVIGPFEHRLLYVQVQVPPDPLLLGYQHFFTVSTISNAFEPNLANNTYNGQSVIVSSYDPNDKVGTAIPTGSTQQYFLDQDHWIDYAIRFQNTGSDTAFTVVIRDEIEADLDIESLQILGASHAFTPSFGEARELVFTFNGINLPDSTTDLLGSQGFVAFRMRARAGLLPGDAIENTAAIYFDFNEPMMTEPSVLVAEFSTDVRAMPEADIHISPNPTTDLLNLRFQPNTSGPIMVIASDGRAVNVPVRITVSGAQIDARALSSGVYQVRVADRSARFIKQ